MFRTIRSLSTLRMVQAPTKPLVAIVGATGTGKSDLAVEIARKYNGEIINGDAMQLYYGLPIITNKITQEERKGIPHHLLGCIGLEEETWTVGKFVGQALSIINQIRARGKLPILVGGTHYYTQSLLFENALADDPALGNQESTKFPILDEPTETILSRLKEVDPTIAERWHPNERRKIQRSLEIFLRTGKPASKIYDEQRSGRNGSPDTNNETGLSGPTGLSLRFPTLLLWVHASKDVLHPRLNSRIEKMLDKGLLSEVETLVNFRSSYESRTGTTIDQTRGIWVSIGYKEFLEYQTALTEPSTSQSELAQLKKAATEKTQAATRQYANRQIRWIRIKLLNALSSADQSCNMFLLDGSDLSTWDEQVIKPACHISDHFLAGNPLPDPSTLSEFAGAMLQPRRNYDLGQRPDLWQKKVCETCGTAVVTENDWNLHMKSRAHRRAVGKWKKQENAEKRPRGEKKNGERVDMVDVLESSIGAFSEDEFSR